MLECGGKAQRWLKSKAVSSLRFATALQTGPSQRRRHQLSSIGLSMIGLRRSVLLPLTSVLCLSSFSIADDIDFFESRIRPVLVERCYKCHSAEAEKLKAGLRLDHREGFLQGSESGQPAVVPGQPEVSRLIEAIRYSNEELQMPPPKSGGKLSEAQIQDFVAWVKMGAPYPKERSTFNVQRSTNSHWAFQKPAEPIVPQASNKQWPKTPVDNFILAKLEASGLQPSQRADKRTLIRRATFDLTGLPPTAKEVERFVRDESPDAFAAVIETLLASPHYGERWGRHWLDVARYSDTKGYVYDREEKRFIHSHVYRDWVVQAFNVDMPYDRFLKLQIAADQICGESNQWDLAALGFLTVGRRFLGVMHDIIDDRIDVLMRGTQGLTASCARCHDHKYDPIPTKDYYSLYGVFYNTSERAVPVSDPVASPEEVQIYVKGLREREEKLQKTFQEKRAKKTDRLRAQAAEYLMAVLDVKKLPSEEFYTIMGPDDLNPVIVRQWEAYIHKTRQPFHPVFGAWNDFARLPDFAAGSERICKELASREGANPLVLEMFKDSPPKSMREVAARYGKLFSEVDKDQRRLTSAATESGKLDPVREQIKDILYGPDSPAAVPDGAIIDIEWFFEEDSRVELAKLQAEIDRWILKAPGAPPHAVILSDRSQLRNARVFLRGNPASKGEEVPRQFLELLEGPNRRPFAHGSGRLELAEAIASAENPLTARVMVNRIWLHHFGAGLVRTASDFGTRSEAPSHPELLDWLAHQFVKSGWSMKQMHRLVMLSATYQQASEFEDTSRAAQIDPDNRLLWRMNRHRLEFEAMRDALLSVSGELDLRMGGKALELFKTPSPPRRTIYGYIDRQFVPAALRMFDFANPDLHIPQRPETTVPQQALFFMNSPFVAERARNLATRVTEGGGDDKIRALYRAAYQRTPTQAELDLARNFLKRAQAQPTPSPLPPPTPVWMYGYGDYDEAAQRVKGFAKLPHFTGDAWQGGANWPDAKLGWVQLTAEGGHPGNDLKHAAVRRWIAPKSGSVRIDGTIHHEPKEGDGIMARIVSSRLGMLGSWKIHAGKADAKAERVEVQEGDTIDFVVDIAGNLNSDQFKWSPMIKLTDASGREAVSEWNAKKDFGGPPAAPPQPLDAWAKFAQILLLSNEFLFVD